MSTFEVVHGAEGDCLLLDDTRISGPKPWGGGTVTKTFYADKAYDVVPRDELDKLKAENARLWKLLQDIADHIKHGDGFGIDRGWMLDRMRELGIEVPE